LNEASWEGAGPFWGNHGGDSGRFGLAFGGDTTGGLVVGIPAHFYVWAAEIQDGRVVATDYAPDAGWLHPTADAKHQRPTAPRRPRRRPDEGSAALDRHVIVSQSSEVIDMADGAAVLAGEGSARAAAFARLADDHLDRAYHLARAILRDETDAQDVTHDA